MNIFEIVDVLLKNKEKFIIYLIFTSFLSLILYFSFAKDSFTMKTSLNFISDQENSKYIAINTIDEFPFKINKASLYDQFLENFYNTSNILPTLQTYNEESNTEIDLELLAKNLYVEKSLKTNKFILYSTYHEKNVLEDITELVLQNINILTYNNLVKNFENVLEKLNLKKEIETKTINMTIDRERFNYRLQKEAYLAYLAEQLQVAEAIDLRIGYIEEQLINNKTELDFEIENNDIEAEREINIFPEFEMNGDDYLKGSIALSKQINILKNRSQIEDDKFNLRIVAAKNNLYRSKLEYKIEQIRLAVDDFKKNEYLFKAVDYDIKLSEIEKNNFSYTSIIIIIFSFSFALSIIFILIVHNYHLYRLNITK